MRRLAAWVLLSGMLLSGCSGMRIIDTQVRAASTLSDSTSLQGASYKFERSPLSLAPNNNPEALETQAEQALSQVGLVRNDAAAALTVLLGLRVTPYLVDQGSRLYGSPFAYGGWGGSMRYGAGIGLGWGMGSRFPPTTLYRHELQILMRDVRSGQLVYETQAVHDGPWNDSANLLPALLSAALKDFPNPGAPVRRVDIESPR
jgi:hypothetical protein